jgi:hypothetical protein
MVCTGSRGCISKLGYKYSLGLEIPAEFTGDNPRVTHRRLWPGPTEIGFNYQYGTIRSYGVTENSNAYTLESLYGVVPSSRCPYLSRDTLPEQVALLHTFYLLSVNPPWP